MPQSVLVQVGQCGNQIGFNFWKSLLEEYRCHHNKLSEDDFCQFLKPRSSAIYPSKSLEENYNARGILIDMEEGVINEGLRSSVGSLFLKNQVLKDVSGSGNNWAVGHIRYGRQYSDSLQELFRIQAESSDNLEAFLFAFSLGGGTGSGLGSYALKVAEDYYPKVSRITFNVFPSDDVVTSPYNAVLCNSELLQHANVIVPFENKAMDKIITKLEQREQKNREKLAKLGRLKMLDNHKKILKSCEKPFDKCNNLIVTTILNYTSVSRYPSFSNKTLSELTLNLAPDEILKYVVPSISPTDPSEDSSSVTRLFNEVFSDDNCLFDCKNTRKILCGASIFSRGEKFSSSAVEYNINRLKNSAEFVNWVPAVFHHGEVKINSVGTPASILMLSNSSGIILYLRMLKIKLQKMISKKANFHHYLNEDPSMYDKIQDADEKLTAIINSYENLQIKLVLSNLPLII